jgi:hypothetical protein
MTESKKQKERRELIDMGVSAVRRRFENTDRHIVKTSMMKAIVKLGVRLKEREDALGGIRAQLDRMRDDDLGKNMGKDISRLLRELDRSVARMPEDRKQMDRAYLEALLLEVGVQVCVINQIVGDLRWAQASALLDAQISR